MLLHMLPFILYAIKDLVNLLHGKLLGCMACNALEPTESVRFNATMSKTSQTSHCQRTSAPIKYALRQEDMHAGNTYVVSNMQYRCMQILIATVLFVAKLVGRVRGSKDNKNMPQDIQALLWPTNVKVRKRVGGGGGGG